MFANLQTNEETVDYRGLKIRIQTNVEDDSQWTEASVFSRDGRYLADCPFVSCFSNMANIVKQWIDANWRLLDACNKI